MKIFFSFFILSHFFSISFAQLWINNPADVLNDYGSSLSLAPSTTTLFPEANGNISILVAWQSQNSLTIRKSLDEGIFWENPVVLTADSVPSIAGLDLKTPPQIIFNDTGVGVLIARALTKTLKGTLLFSSSLDYGNTWEDLSAPLLGLGDLGKFAAAIGSGPLPDIVVVFERFAGSYHHIYSFVIVGGIEYQFLLSNRFLNSFDPRLSSMDPRGHAVAVFQTHSETHRNTTIEAQYWGGNIWFSAHDISNPENNAYLPSVSLDANNNARAIWAETTPQGEHIIQTAYSPTGTIWTHPLELARYASEAKILQTEIALNNNGIGVGAWRFLDSTFEERELSSRKNLVVTSFINNQWSREKFSLLALEEGALDFQLALTEENIAALLYRSYDLRNNTTFANEEEFFGTVNFIVSGNGGQSWIHPPIELSLRQNGVSTPSLAADRTKLYMTWNRLIDVNDAQQQGVFASYERLFRK